MPGTSRSGGDRTVALDGFPAQMLPDAPERMSNQEREVWHSIVASMPDGYLHALDAFQLAILCECIVTKNNLQDRIRKDATDTQLIAAYHRYTAQINRLSAQFGLSPADRRRIKVEPTADVDDAEEWLNS